MTRVLELIVAVILVVILAIVVGLFLPSHGHIQRSIEVSHDPHHIYDILNNFRRFQDYSGPVLGAEDPHVKISLSGSAYGPGSKVSWSGDDKVGHGTLTNLSGNLDPTGSGKIVWAFSSDWRGRNKTFEIDLEPRNNQRLTRITWSYDVDYGWNLIDRYSQFYLHGDPATLIQYSLNSLQNLLASIPNVDYTKIHPRMVETLPVPVLFVSTQAPRTLDDVDAATSKAMTEIDATIKKLGVHQNGPRTTITTEYGDQNYLFDVAVPIDSSSLTIDGQAHDLTQLVAPPPPTADQDQDQNQDQSSDQEQAQTPPQPAPGSTDDKGHLVVDGDVRAMMMPGGRTLEADWQGTPAGLPLMRLALKAYAQTHGYAFDDTTHRYYDLLVSAPGVPYDMQDFQVYLPVLNAPAQTPEQAAGSVPPLALPNPASWGQGAGPATASSSAAATDESAGSAKKAEKAKPKAKPKSKKKHH